MATVRKVGIYGPDKLDSGEWELRWRLYMTDGNPRERRRGFARKALADAHGEKLVKAVDNNVDRVTGRRWGWSPKLEPILLGDTTEPVDPANIDTVWRLVGDWRTATWGGASGNGRKNQSYALRFMVRHLLRDTAAPVPPEVDIYLLAVAFRQAKEPTLDELRAAHPTGIVRYRPAQRQPWAEIDVDALWSGRLWIERHSLPVASLDRPMLRDLLADIARGRAASTESRYWSSVHAVLGWGTREGDPPRVKPGLTDGVDVRSVPRSALDEVGEVPNLWELRTFAFAVGQAAGSRWCALPLVMGAGGLRVGECAALVRSNITDDNKTDGLWINVRRNRATPGKAWTDNGEAVEIRGTKRKGPHGNLKGRRTYLPPKEAAILRTHLDLFVGPGANAPVFTTASGAIIGAHLDRDVWDPAARLVFPAPHRLAGMNRHALRHLAATRWLRQGFALTTAARWGGWAQVSTMVDFYDSVLPNDDDGAAALMAAE